MRFLFCLLIASFATGTLVAQNSVDQFFNQYAGVEHINQLNLQGSLLQFVANIEDDKKTKNTITKLHKLSALWIEDFNPIAQQDVKRLRKNLQKDYFEPLIMVKEGDSNVNLWIQENEGNITGVVLLIDGSDNFLLINLAGKLKFEDLGDIDVDIEGMDYFKKLPKKRSDLKRA